MFSYAGFEIFCMKAFFDYKQFFR